MLMCTCYAYETVNTHVCHCPCRSRRECNDNDGGSCKTFFDGRVERVDRVDLDAEMFQLAHGAA